MWDVTFERPSGTFMPIPTTQLFSWSSGNFDYEYTRNVNTTIGTDGVTHRSGTATGDGAASSGDYNGIYEYGHFMTWSGGWTDTYSDTGVSGTSSGSGSSGIVVDGGGPTWTMTAAPTLTGAGIYANPNPNYGRNGSTPCFTAGTQVLVGYDELGNPVTKSIEEIQVGDTVLSKDEHDAGDSIEPRRVTAIEVYTVYQIRLLEIEEADGTTGVLQTTDEHPFWVVGMGWVKAGELQVGQQFLSADGDLVTLSATSSEEHPEGISVYNLTVEEDHTFFVSATSGDEMVWVHNENGPAVGTPPQGTQWYPAGPSVAPYKVPLPGPTSPTSVPKSPPVSGGGMSPEMKGNLLIWGGMLADNFLYNNWGWYKNRIDDINEWKGDTERWVTRNIYNPWGGGQPPASTPAPAPQPQLAAGGVGQKPPAPPIAPTSQPSDQPDVHHIMTNKNNKSTAAGGPYTPKFEDLARQRGITLEDEINKMLLEGHRGPHPEYNAEVFRRLSEATDGKTGAAFNQAFDDTMAKIKAETETLGTLLNQLATGAGGQ